MTLCSGVTKYLTHLLKGITWSRYHMPTPDTYRIVGVLVWPSRQVILLAIFFNESSETSLALTVPQQMNQIAIPKMLGP